MTKSDEGAISKQIHVKRHSKPVPLDEETRAAIREGSEQAERGEFVSDEEMAAFFNRHRK
jgi:predicted transcriptional regulator